MPHALTSTHTLLRTCVLGFILTSCALCALWAHTPTMQVPASAPLLSLLMLVVCAYAIKRCSPWPHAIALTTGVLLASLRVSLALSPPAPIIHEPEQLFATVEVSSQAEPTPHGWRLRLTQHDTSRVFLATLPYASLEDPHAAPLPGTVLHADLIISPTPARALPGDPHPATLLTMQDVHAYARIQSIETTHMPRDSPTLALARWRLGLIRTLRTTLPERSAALTLAMTLGVKGLLPPDLKEPFSVTGTSHLLAISGLHLGTLAALLAALIKTLLAPWLRHTASRRGIRALTYPAMSLTLSAYVLCIGAPTSARRALTMLLILLATHGLRRRLPPTTTLLWAAGLMCLLDPMHTLEPAFWLSVGATFAILHTIQARSLIAHAETTDARWRHTLRQGVHVSCAAWLGTAPIVLCLTHELPLVGIPLNMVLVPLVGLVIFPMMVLGVLLTFASPTLASYPLRLSTHLLESSAGWCEQAAMWPGATWRPGALPMWLTLVAAALVALALYVHRTRRAHAMLALCATWGAITLHGLWLGHTQRGTLRVDFIPVGQGDATLITFPDGATMLVDAGGRHLGRDPGAARVLPLLRQRGITQLDTMVLTHADVDHMRGMFAVVRRATPRAFIAAPDADVGELTALRDALDARHIPTTTPPSRHTFTHAGARVILHTIHDQNLGRNDRSVVLEIHYRGASILLPGDIERAAELRLIPTLSSPITLIKMPHHGSHTSSTDALLEHLDPTIAIASCGLHNRFDHPRAEVLERYARRGIRVWRTDHHGLITATVTEDGALTIAHPIQIP